MNGGARQADIAGALGLLVFGTAIQGAVSRGRQRRRKTQRAVPLDARGVAAVDAARKFNRGAGLLALSVLCDSAIEHYRGSFRNKAMYTPLVVSSAALAISLHGTRDVRRNSHGGRDLTYLAAALTGCVGTGFHVYNVLKRPGGFVWQNLFYGAPLGAPFAILLSGLLGVCAERVRENEPGRRLTVLGRPAGRLMSLVTALGLLGTTGEAGLLHFRGAYHDPFMFIPVTLPPVVALRLFKARQGAGLRSTRLWLRLLSLVGLAGVGFHALGVARNMGGWANWRQNLLNGPPLPAPPSFSGLALAGLAALDLLEHPDA